MVREKPGFFAKIGGIFDPGGDPGAIHGAADACRKLAADLTSTSAALGAAKEVASASWQGPGSDAFKQAADKFEKDVNDVSPELLKAADTLDKQAKQLEDARRQARNLQKMAIAAIAAGAALAIWSFGTSAAAAAGEVAVLETTFFALIRSVGAALIEQGLLMTAIRATVATVVKRMFVGMVASWGVAFAVKPFQGLNPLDPASWTGDDVSNILLGGILTGGLLQASKVVKGLTPFRAGLIGGGAGSSIMQFGVQEKPLTWGTAATVALTAGTAGLGGKYVAAPLADRISARLPTQAPPARAVTLSGRIKQTFGTRGPNAAGRFTQDDWVKVGTGLPTGVAFYVYNLTGLLGATPEKAGFLQGPPAAPEAPSLPRTPQPSQQRSEAPPSSVTVQRGDSLSAIAQRVYGDSSRYPDIATANNIDPSDPIYPNQILKIPPAQVPAGSP